VRSPSLTKFGPANPVTHRRSVAHKPYDVQIRQTAIKSLLHLPVILNDAQIAAIGRGITKEIEQFGAATMHAFVQLRNHFHFVCGPCRYDIRRFQGRLKGAAARQLMDERIHPMQKFADAKGNVPSMWSAKPWTVYLFSGEDIIRSVQYANDNLTRARLPDQKYRFIVPYGGI